MNLSLHDYVGEKTTALPKQKMTAVRPIRFLLKLFMSLSMLLVLPGLHESLSAQLNTAINLSTYVRVGRYDLPEPTRTVPPVNSLLAQEASGVAYNWDTHTLFVVGDGGTSVVQVSKTGQLINSMTLAQGSSPQGTTFYDPEGITYVGNGKFVLIEERDRQAVLFTYVAGTTLTRAATQTVKLGTFVPNIGIEGLCYDPLTNGFICVKEIQPQGIFQTGIDFVNGTATNGSPTTENSVNLFDPALTGLADFADVFALSNIPGLTGLSNFSNLIVLSQESGKIINVSRSGVISSSLTIVSDPGNPLSVPDQQHEGLVMDENGILYVVSENGGGDFDHPQLWVYAPSNIPNQAPTAITLQNAVTSILENSSTISHVKVADILVTDDGLGTNQLSITGSDAAYFEIAGSEIFIKAGTVLDYETKPTYNITVNVNDVTVGGNPDASTNYTLNLIDVIIENQTAANVAITEVAPWSSGNSPVGADWFEVTNNSSTVLNITGWKMDDASNSFASSVALNGITSIAPGESVIFLETATPATTIPLFISTWFGANPPTGLQVGSYTGSGVGLSTGGDGVSLFNATGLLQAKVSFDASPAGPYPTFDNGSGQDNITISLLSTVNRNGAFAAVNDAAEIGSPGSIGKLFISEVSPWSSGNSPVGADWFEVTNLRAAPITITGWKMDDNSFSFSSSVALNGITTIAPGESVIFLETATPSTTIPLFLSTWFGTNPPAGLQVGSYTGSGVGLSTGGDAVVLYDAGGREQARVSFGNSPTGPYPTFDNKAGLNNTTISQLSVAGVNGAFAAVNDAPEIGSPGVLGKLFISEVSPWSSGNSPVAADWFEVTNTKATAVNVTGWKMDDNSGSAAAAVALNGINSIAPGESVIFIETATPATTIPLFLSTWFGTTIPAGLQVGSYTGNGVGLGTGGDEVNLYNSFNQLQARVVFGASSSAAPFKTFDNAAALNNTSISQLSAASVNGAFPAYNDASEIGSPGTINAKFIPGKIEAESFDAKSGPFYTTTTTDAGGGQKIIGITNGSWMDYNVVVSASGSYTVKFRVATTKNNAQFQLKEGNSVLATVNVPNTGSWDNWVTVPVKNVSLTAGTKIIRIISTNNENCDFNWMEFGLTSATDKFIPGKIEAESFDAKSGPLYALPTADEGGGQKIVGITNGSWMDYNVAVTETGLYAVRFRVGTTQNNAQFQIKLGAAVLGTINIPNTGGWDTWQTVTLNNVSLSAGMQTIRIQSINNETCNFNWVDWSLIVPASKLIAGKIEAENFDTRNGGMYAVPTNDAGGGQQVVGLSNGGWLDYNVTVAQTGTYTVNFRIATPQNNAQLQVKLGATVLGTRNIPNTGGWDSWQTIALNNISLTAGVQTIRIQLSSNESFNFNWMDWILASAPAAPLTIVNTSTDIVPIAKENKGNYISVSVFPNPAASYFNLKVQSKNMEQVMISVVDMAGKQVEQWQAIPGQTTRFGDKMTNGVYMIEVRQGSERIVTKVIKQ